MKGILYLILLMPVFGIAQSKAKPATKAKPKTVVAKETKPLDGFVINGDIKGYADGTTVAILNGSTGATESETTITKDKFTLTGKLTAPDFKIILINKIQPYITLFLDNSLVKISASNGALDRAVITGSPSHKDYETLSQSLAPYQNAFNQNAPYDSVAEARVKQITESFVKQHAKSYVAPLAVIRYIQLGDDSNKPEELFNLLPAEIKASAMGNYAAQQISDAKKIPVGNALPDFTQADTSGKPVSLSSFRGKYVLVDFWASWCHPCREENPNVLANYNKFKDKNFTVLGVSLDKAKPAWLEAIKQDGLPWTHVSDLQGWSNAVAQQFQIFSIPQNILVDPEGKVVGKNLRGTTLDRKLSKLLK